MSGTARLRLAGLPSTGQADFSAEKGSGNTPRNGAGSIATVATETPRPGDLGEQASEGMTDDRRLLRQDARDGFEMIGDLADRLMGHDAGMRIGFIDRIVVRQPGPP